MAKKRWPKKIATGLAYLEDSQSWSLKARSAPSCSQAVGNLVEAARRYGIGKEYLGGAPGANPTLLAEESRAGNALSQAEEKTVKICERG